MPSFGDNLRRERELRGVTLREIADATNISLRFLQALEQDRVDQLPGGLFPRAFLRQYARHLGLDAERLVAEFVYAHEERAPETAAVAPQRSGAPPRALAIAAGVLLLAAVVGLVRSGAGRDEVPRREAAPAAPATAAPMPAIVDRVYPSPATQAGRSDGLVLTLSARQDCWVAVKVDGHTVLDRVLSEGESQTIEAAGEIVLSVGNAGGLEFTLNDQPGMPLGRSGEVRKNIVITRQNLPTLVQDDAVRADSRS